MAGSSHPDLSVEIRSPTNHGASHFNHPKGSAVASDTDHLARLLGALSLPSNTTPKLSQPFTVGSLPTPSMSPLISTPRNLSTPPPATQTTFSSPTPPHSGNSLKLPAIPLPLDYNVIKPKFEFVSPFDVFNSPVIASKPVQPASQALHGVASTMVKESPIMTQPEQPVTHRSHASDSGRSINSASSTNMSSPPAINHIVPPSIMRARASSHHFSPPSPLVSSPAPMPRQEYPTASTPDRPMSVSLSQTTPNRKAQQVALLQSVAGDILAKSVRMHTPPLLSSPKRDAFVVDPGARMPGPSPLRGLDAITRGTPSATSYIPHTDLRRYQDPNPGMLSHSSTLAPTSAMYGTRLDQGPTASPSYYSHNAIPVVPPTAPLQRGQLLSLLNGSGPTPTNAHAGGGSLASPFMMPSFPHRAGPPLRTPPLSSGPVVVGPPIPGLNAPDSPFVVQPHPPRQYVPVYHPGLPQAPPPPPNAQLLSILNRAPPSLPY